MATRRRRLLGVLAIAALAGPLAGPAAACGGLFCQNIPVDQAGERILFATDGENVTAHVQIQYQGAAKDFSWIVPVPTAPTLAVGSDLLFQRLRAATRPTFQLDLREDGCEYPADDYDTGLAVEEDAGPGADEGGVTVVSQQQVGPYDSAVIQSNDPGALKAWLRTNGYTIPGTIDPLLDPYVAGKYFFLALKLQKDRDAGDLQPIAFTYRSTKPAIPIRLTGVAATPDMGVFVWVLGKARAVPENYRHALINEARIDWLGGGDNYPQVVTEAMNEAGGQAFVTDYAGPSDKVGAGAFAASRFDLAALRAATHPVDFAEAVAAQDFFGGDPAPLVAFLKRWIKKPAAEAATPDDEFYRFIADHREAFDARQQSVDTAGAIADLEAKVVRPLADLEAMFQRHSYLTALYTTMSPDEMTQDPVFVANRDLPEVASEHVAKGVRRCGQGQDPWTAPVEITLASGLTYTARNGASLDQGRPLAMPAAMRIEQLKTTGRASLIRDNQPLIATVLANAGVAAAPTPTPGPSAAPAASAAPSATPPAQAVAIGPTGQAVAVPATPPSAAPAAGGFGCAGCSNPARSAGGPGAGEGLTFALFFAGLLGWRRWRPGRRTP